MKVAKLLGYAAFGWLALTGALHFAIDVVSQYVRGVRSPSPETTLYYGLNTSFALGQVVVGIIGMWLARRAPEALRAPVIVAATLLAAVGWCVLTFFFMEYRPPRVNAVIFGALLVASLMWPRR